MRKIAEKMRKTDCDKYKKIVKIFLMFCIGFYPFMTSFYGIDLGDTGIHMLNYENIFSNPELIGFTSYFTSVTGWMWLNVFPGLGIWGLNLLEVFIEIVMAAVIYKTFGQDLGELETLFGILIAVLASDTYLNIFNYHQYNVLFLILILSFQYKAIIRDKKIFSVFAGIFFTLVVCSRMGSVTAVITCFLYIFWYMYENKEVKYLFKHI